MQWGRGVGWGGHIGLVCMRAAGVRECVRACIITITFELLDLEQQYFQPEAFFKY